MFIHNALAMISVFRHLELRRLSACDRISKADTLHALSLSLPPTLEVDRRSTSKIRCMYGFEDNEYSTRTLQRLQDAPEMNYPIF